MKQKNPRYSETEQNLFKSIYGSLSFHYGFGRAMSQRTLHKETEWRILPYTTIVAMGWPEARYSVEIKDMGVIPIHSGDVIVIPQGASFKFQLQDITSLADAHISFSIFETIDILAFFEFPLLIKNSQTTAQIIDILNKLAVCDTISKNEQIDFYNLVRMNQLTCSLLELLIQQSNLRSDTNKRLSDLNRVQEVINYMTAHMSEPLNRKKLAELMHLSESRFHHVFKEIIGTSPINYLTMLRLQRAQENLLMTNESVLTISESLGFGSLSGFCKLFKKHFHVSPLQYRQMKNTSLFS